MPPAARVGDSTAHGGTVMGPGVSNVMIAGMPSAVVGDMHVLHAQEHGVILADPQLRNLANAGDQGAMAIVQAVLAHIMEHKQLHESQDQFWFVVSGEKPPPPPMMPQPPPNAPAGPEMSGPPPGPPMMPPPPPPSGPPQQPAQAPPIPPLPPELRHG